MPLVLPAFISNEDRVHNNQEEEDNYQVSEGYGYESKKPLFPPSFAELELEMKESIQPIGGALFPNLNWSAPKDCLNQHNSQMLLIIVIALLLFMHQDPMQRQNLIRSQEFLPCTL